MASGWNLWVWLQCIGVASGCCCKEVYTVDILTIIINFPTPLVLALFFGSSIPTSLFIFKMFFRSLIYSSVQYTLLCCAIMTVLSLTKKSILYFRPVSC